MGPGSAVGLLLLCGLGGGARVLHSMRYLSIAVSDPSPGVPRFQAMGYVDRNLFVHCSSESKRCQPRTQWIEDNVGQEYWDRVNLIAQTIQQLSYDGLNTLRDLYNQSGVSPTVRVSGKEQEDGILTLTCRAHGFYPRPIVLSWLKDGEVRDQDTQWGGLAPNSDGTYYTWASIEAHPGDKDRFRCRVEHASLLQPGLYALEPHSDLLSILLPVAAVVLVAITIIGVLLWKLRAGLLMALPLCREEQGWQQRDPRHGHGLCQLSTRYELAPGGTDGVAPAPAWSLHGMQGDTEPPPRALWAQGGSPGCLFLSSLQSFLLNSCMGWMSCNRRLLLAAAPLLCAAASPSAAGNEQGLNLELLLPHKC
ncbi:class I histocompatibility antigen, F10 alpha chain-like isoform X6 [Melopsittacus undulatus]|uniref:class I histocompatibility antigen, F10 alpha chain-like isoform X6 n=1 Tax=Melopsittacus undulatus TaxID=13146 RepID=UPI00146C3AF0|nr:class I histocompatibility antigen, F10 alpha chain-like isoform X6 [Melopsittacus undulatus]